MLEWNIILLSRAGRENKSNDLKKMSGRFLYHYEWRESCSVIVICCSIWQEKHRFLQMIMFIFPSFNPFAYFYFALNWWPYVADNKQQCIKMLNYRSPLKCHSSDLLWSFLLFERVIIFNKELSTLRLLSAMLAHCP